MLLYGWAVLVGGDLVLALDGSAQSHALQLRCESVEHLHRKVNVFVSVEEAIVIISKVV